MAMQKNVPLSPTVEVNLHSVTGFRPWGYSEGADREAGLVNTFQPSDGRRVA